MDTAEQSLERISGHIHLDDMALQQTSTLHSLVDKINSMKELQSSNTISKENLNAEQIRLHLRDSRDSMLRKHRDHFDYSNSPSYSQFKLPYHLICRERYRLTKKMYERQLQSEIQQIINQQTTAFDAVCFVRVMAITSLWPPLHNRRNIEHSHQQYFQMMPKQKKRLEYIMRVDWSKT